MHKFETGADLGFFVLQSKKNRTGRGQRRAWSAQGVVSAGRGGRRGG